MKISGLQMTAASPEQIEDGLLGWTAFVFEEAVKVDGVMVRRTLRGDLTLSYPMHTDRFGNRYYALRPINDAARREIEREVFRRLGLE